MSAIKIIKTVANKISIYNSEKPLQYIFDFFIFNLIIVKLIINHTLYYYTYYRPAYILNL